MIISKRSHLNRIEKERHLLPLIEDFCSSEPAELARKLTANLQWNLPQGNLLHWVRLLNLFDDIFEKQIDKYGLGEEHAKLREFAAEDAAVVIACLKFTKTLLDHCTNRSIYASAERVFALVNSAAIDVKLAALEVALCLGERYVYGSQHKKFVAPKPARLRLLETARAFPPPVPASFIQSRQEQGDKGAKEGPQKANKDHYSWVDALDHKQKYPSKWKAVHFEYYNSRPADKERDKKRAKKKPQPEEGLAALSLSEEHVRKLSLEQLYDRAVESLPEYTWFSFAFHAMNAKAFNTKSHDSMQLRRKLLRAKCLAIACVTCFCSADFTSCQLFELEPYTLNFLTDLVSPENTSIVTPELFYTASKTLRAISMKRVWGSEIVRHLGGNVNHGLLYEVLRHINKQARLGSENPFEDGHRLFLTILGDLVESKTLAPRLVAGGLLTELMAFMDIRGENRWASSAAVHILTSLLTGSPEFVADFADNNGFNLLISAINYEVDFALANPGYAGGAPTLVPVHHTISLRQVKQLRVLLDFVSNLISSDAGDRLRNLFDSPLLDSFNKIVMHPEVFGPAVLATTLDNVAQIIHNEPTAFSILNEAGLVLAILGNYEHLFMPLGELLLSLLEVLGAFSLNKDGMAKVVESCVLSVYFRSFYNLELAKESMRADMCTNIGCSMDELGRHNPPLRPVIMREIKVLISTFASYANDQLSSITFYSSDLGNMYVKPSEAVVIKEDGQEEIESWEGMFSSNLIDNVFGFLNGLLQDTGQWGKDVIEEIKFSTWESFFTMPNTPFDFTVSNGVLNLVAVLKYLDDEVQSYGLAQILESLSSRLNSQRVRGFLTSSEKQSYFIELGTDPTEATLLLKELNCLNNLLFVLTEIYLNPSSISNETYQVLFDYLKDDFNLIQNLVDVLQTAICEETNIRAALPDEIMEKTSPSLFYTIKSSAIRILPRKPPAEEQHDESTSAKYKNTLQLRFLMDSLMNNTSVILSCVSRSCMHRRQDFFTDSWRMASVIATKQLATSLSGILRGSRQLHQDKQLEYVLRTVHAITFISIYKDRGKEVLSTSFVSCFYSTTDIAKSLFSQAVSAFKTVCELPKSDLIAARELSFIQNTQASIGFNALNLLFSFICKLLSRSHVNKYPMTSYFYNKEYCGNENLPVDGVISQSAFHAMRLLSLILGTKSIFSEIDDYSLISEFPTKISESLVNMIRLTWDVNPIDDYYPLNEDWMTPAYEEVEFMEDVLDLDGDTARQLLAFGKSIKNFDVISEKAEKMGVPDWYLSKSKLKNTDFANLFKYDPVQPFPPGSVETLRKQEESQIYSIALIQLACHTRGLDRAVALAYQSKGVDSALVKSIFGVLDHISQINEDVKRAQSTNLIYLLDEIICREPFVAESKFHVEFSTTFETFIDNFLSNVMSSPELADTEYFAAGLSLMLPVLSHAPPTVYSELTSRIPTFTASLALKEKIAATILQLQPSKNVKSVTLLGRYMYLMAKEETYKERVVKSPLLACIIKSMKALLEAADKDNLKTLQDSIILVIRTCFDTKSTLLDVFSAEITKIMKKHTGMKRELGQMIHESRPLIGRDPDYFLEVASKMVRLDNYDGKSTSGEKLYLLDVKERDTLQSSNDSDVEMKDCNEMEDSINPSGLVYTLLSQLMSITKEDWYTSPQKTAEEADKPNEKKNDASEFDFLMENKKFSYMCFLLQSLCELVGSYNQAKLEFITFSKKVKNEEKNKPRLTSLNFFIHQLIPSYSLVSSTGPEFHRREAISSLAKLTLLALVSTTIQENDAEPDPRKEDADMAIVRKLMVDIISKILRETIHETTNITRVYSKIHDIFDLCSCLLSAKFRELCYPLLSKSATKSDQFYVASAFIDSHLGNQISSVISNIDLNFPEVSKVINTGLKTLSSLAKIKLANADLFETALSGDKDDEDIDEEEDRDETPDLFRNSTLGMYDLDLESEEEEEFYQDQAMGPLSESDISEDESDDSDEMSYSDMDSEIEEGELVEDDQGIEEGYEGFDSDDSENNISFIEDLDIHSADGSDFNSEASDFNGFESNGDVSEDEGDDGDDDDEDFSDDDEMEYTEAELDGWEEAFADLPESGGSNERVRFGNIPGEEAEDGTRFDFDSEGRSESELEDDIGPEAVGSQARTTRESITSFFNALRPMGSPILSLNPSGILAGSIQIGSNRTNDSAFPQLDAAFQALLTSEQSKSSVDHMLIRSSVERWAGTFSFYFRRFETVFLEMARSKLKEQISTSSYEIFKRKAEEREQQRQKRQEMLKKRREEALRKREAELREREAAQGPTEAEPREPVMLWIGNREVDISGTDIDPEFFEALPDDMREEVFTQHIRERRANANSTGGEAREIDPDFLDALPEQIRNEILQQESMTRRFSSEGFGLFRDEDELDSEMEEEYELAEVMEEDGTGEAHNENTVSHESEQIVVPAKKKKSFSVPLIDRAGVASLIKLLFLPRPINQREHIYSTLVSICNNKSTRADVVSMLIAVLHDGLVSQKALEKMFSQVASKAKKNDQQIVSESFPIGCTPISIGVQLIEALLYLLEKTPALRLFLLTEHENSFLTKKHLKKFRLKKTSLCEDRFPINLLFRLLDNPLLSEEHLFIDLLSNVLNYATRPLLMMKDTKKPTPASFSTNFIPDRNLRSIIKILASNECVNSTFRSTISCMHHLSSLNNAQNVFSTELSERASELGDLIVKDLKTLTGELADTSKNDAHDNKVVSKFTASSSDQAKLLRILTALDYMYESQKRDHKSDGPKEELDRLNGLYKHLQLGTLWKALSDCLRILEDNIELSHVATALLPLIEALMVVCKHSKVKEFPIKDVMKYEVKKIDFTKEPIESLFFSFTDEHKKILNQMVRSNPNLMSGPFSMLVKNSRVLEFDNKRNYFSRQLHDGKEPSAKMSVSIRREQVFLDSYRALFFKSVEEFKKAHLEINFKGEAGIDAGGVTREWYQVLSRQMFNPDYALFTAVASDENTYHPNRTSYINPEHLSFFKFIGRTIGKAIYDGCFLDCHFSRAVYKKILDQSVSLKDMESLDLEYYKSLIWMLENDITDIITEDFSVETDDYGEHKIIDLVPDGRNIPVTEENKQDYVRLVVEYRLQTSVNEQMQNFITGFHEIIPRELVAIFDEQELELLISGLPDIDVQDWQNNTNYNNYSASSEQIQWFWRAVKSFDNEERAKLLQFSTGTSKVPLNGFKDLRGANGVCKFSIHRDYGAKDRLPSSHTCFNQIDLPVYESYETLRGSLLLAVSEGHEGFQLA
ncbi:hypothetical protein OXX69_000314 [Metschnikowia pulcherrima]